METSTEARILRGANGAGTIFKIAPSGTMTVLHSFGGNDGSQVFAPLIQGTDGNFYGVASAGGTHGDGTIFQITPSGAYTVLYNFAGSDGADPLGAMVQDAQGNFERTTNTGGTSNGKGFQVSVELLHAGRQ